MSYNPQFHHRRSIRIKGYDYTQPGGYFVTLVTQERACLFGEVVNSEIHLSPLGQVVGDEWMRLTKRFPNVELDEFVVMPNHLHGIVVLIDPAGRGTGDIGESRATMNHPCAPTRTIERFGAPVPGSIPTIIRSYKSSVTQRAQWMGRGTGVNKGSEIPENFPRAPTVWQRNFYEHVIRNEMEWERIRLYIRENPGLWAKDRENPSHR